MKQYAYKKKSRERGVEQINLRNAVMFSVPEIDTLTALGGRGGSTLMHTLAMDDDEIARLLELFDAAGARWGMTPERGPAKHSWRAALARQTALGEPIRVLLDKRPGKATQKRWAWVKKRVPPPD